MSKFEKLKYLKLIKARVEHSCDKCGALINPRASYYAETLMDIFLYKLHSKKICTGCYNMFGEELLKY